MGKKLMVLVIMIVLLLSTGTKLVYCNSTDVEIGDIVEDRDFTVTTDGFDINAHRGDYYSSSESKYVGKVEQCGYTNYATIAGRTYEFTDEDFSEGFKRVCKENSYQISQDLKEKWNIEEETRRQEEEKEVKRQETKLEEEKHQEAEKLQRDREWEEAKLRRDRKWEEESESRREKNKEESHFLTSAEFENKTLNHYWKCMHKGNECYQNEQLEDALSYYESASIDWWKEPIRERNTYINCSFTQLLTLPNFNLGLIALKKKEYNLAIEHFQQAIQNADKGNGSIEYYRKIGEKRLMITLFDTVPWPIYAEAKTKLYDPDKIIASSWYNLGLAYDGLGNTKLALEAMNKYLSLNQQDNEWTRWARKYIEMHPTPPEPTFTNNVTQPQKQEETAGIQTETRKQEMTNTELAGFYLAHGIDLLYANKDLSAAYLELKQALELDPQKPDTYYHIAYIHRRNGEIGAARWCYDTALKLGLKNSSYVSSAQNFLEVSKNYYYDPDSKQFKY